MLLVTAKTETHTQCLLYFQFGHMDGMRYPRQKKVPSAVARLSLHNPMTH